MVVRRLVPLALLLAACSDDEAAQPDAMVEPMPDASSDVCGPTELYFTGEYLDWDSSATHLRGIGDAMWTVRGATPVNDRTEASGRFELCIPADPMLVADIVPAAGSGYVPGIALIDKDVVTSNFTFSIRSFTETRGMEAPFFYKPERAQVYIQIYGTPRAVTLTAPHDPAQRIDGEVWKPGNTGNIVCMPNVDASGGETKIVIPGANHVPVMVPIKAGTFTYVVVTSS